MVRINLAPEEKRARRLSAPSLPSVSGLSPSMLAGVAALVVLLVVVFLYVGERRALSEARAGVAEAQADSARLRGAVARVTAMQEAQDRLQVQVRNMESVVEGRLYWIGFLETLSRELPPYTWLEKVDRENLIPENAIRIAGGTFSNAAVTDYMRGLEASPELQAVTLVGVSRVQQDSVSYQAFTLVASYENYDAVVVAPRDTTPQEGQ